MPGNLITNPAVIAAVAALLAAFMAALTAFYGHGVSKSNARLQAELASSVAKTQATLTANVKLAEMRQAWINALRDDMASFQSLGVTPGIDHAAQQEFYRLGTRIELRMNPTDDDFEELKSCLYGFLEARTTEEKYAANPGYVTVCQRILKREWDVLKAEVKEVEKP